MAKRTSQRTDARVAVCLYPGVWESSASLAMDLLHIANLVALSRTGQGIETRFVGAEIGEVVTASGARMATSASWLHLDVDLVVLPSLAMPMLDPGRNPPGLADWIVHQRENGALVLAVTTGSWLLAATGLLDGHTAATHWACLDLCRAEFPAVEWSGEQRVTLAGALVTARDVNAAATAVCHMVGQLINAAVAERTYEYSLIRTPGASVLPLLHTVSLRQHQDLQVLRVQEWLEVNFAEDESASNLARMVHLSPRSLRRRFRDATGMTLTAYRTEIRLARARAMLLATTEPVAQIAYSIGYENASTFIALFRSRHGSTPAVYRKNSFSLSP